MTTNNNLVYVVLLLATSFFASCGGNGTELDTPTSGDIKISADETFYPVVDAELQVFQALYTKAKVTPQYGSEQQAMKDLFDDSVRLAIVARDLTDDEKKFFEQLTIKPRITKVAIDAIALITNPENHDSILTIQQVSDLFTGKTSSWKTIDDKSDLNDIQVVFDNNGSSTARYIKEKFKIDSFPAYCSAVKTNQEVVNYVAEHKGAIGVIGVNWISDGTDTTARDFLTKIQVIRISTDSTGPRGEQPYQAYIAKGTYPLTRNIYIISREARSGLGTGFASFVAGDKGQRIILKSGLMPATMPVRIVGFH